MGGTEDHGRKTSTRMAAVAAWVEWVIWGCKKKGQILNLSLFLVFDRNRSPARVILCGASLFSG